MKVFVARYEHRHGDDCRVFDSAEGAEQWRRALADEWWEQEFGNKPMPTDPEEAADEYFLAMECNGGREEFFTVEELEVESVPAK